MDLRTAYLIVSLMLLIAATLAIVGWWRERRTRLAAQIAAQIELTATENYYLDMRIANDRAAAARLEGHIEALSRLQERLQHLTYALCGSSYEEEEIRKENFRRSGMRYFLLPVVEGGRDLFLEVCLASNHIEESQRALNEGSLWEADLQLYERWVTSLQTHYEHWSTARRVAVQLEALIPRLQTLETQLLQHGAHPVEAYAEWEELPQYVGVASTIQDAYSIACIVRQKIARLIRELKKGATENRPLFGLASEELSWYSNWVVQLEEDVDALLQAAG